MGISNKSSQMRWLPLSIYGASFMRVVLEEEGIGSESGFILVADDEQQAKRFIHAYCKATEGNGCQLTVTNYKKEQLNNYCVGMLHLLDCSQGKVDDFLSSKTFFPVVISGGVLPTHLKEGYNIFRLYEEDVRYVENWVFKEDIAELKSYIVKNINKLRENWKLLDSSVVMMKYGRETGNRNLFKLFLAICDTKRCQIRAQIDEIESQNFYKYFVSSTLDRMRRIQEFADGLDLYELFPACIWNYMYDGNVEDIQFIDEADTETLNAMYDNRGIIYDDEFYYVLEDTCKIICNPILSQCSWLELKHQLAEVGMIEKTKGGFTFQKIVLSGKETRRIRVMKLRKDFLTNSDGISLEDYFMEEDDDEEGDAEE